MLGSAPSDFEQASASQLKLHVFTDYLLTHHFSWFLSHAIFNTTPLFLEIMHYLCISVVHSWIIPAASSVSCSFLLSVLPGTPEVPRNWIFQDSHVSLPTQYNL